MIQQFATLPEALWWESRRVARLAARTVGSSWLVLLACAAVVVISAWWLLRMQMRSGESPASIRTVAPDAPAGNPMASSLDGLAAFDKLLIAHEEAPWVLSELFGQAEASGLALARATYSSSDDVPGQYRRVLIAFPLKGRPDALRDFLNEALRKHRSLALTSASFVRGSVASPEVEAKINLVLLTRLPMQSAMAVDASSFDPEVRP
ncbi:hypothetical protein [Piscinibacter sp. HJYY11]|uniref:hypothetical protein n=1 Tax=Piscinibacter sp. HJYY11 TaxID=2801333 RepID=UPI00191D3D52|nr:hypothetical protein [Piscinibacter sp. HJYY11]MBL0729596.1 hypothetical protein [Piscinibacter sp. HJYY11]